MSEITQYSIKYRPRKWEEVYGQDQIVKALKKRSLENNWPKAILFQGPFGTGKTTLAEITAACIQKTLPDGNPDWNDVTNKSILNETFDCDVVRIDGSQDSGKDTIVGLSSLLKTKPMFSKKRVILLEEADQLSNAARYALLKILEQPNANTHFILLSMESNGIPNSIKSRCQVYNVKLLDVKSTMYALKHVLEEEELWKDENIPDDFKVNGLSTIAISSKGSLRMALQNLESCVVNQAYTKDEIEKLLNTVDEISTYKVLGGILSKSKDEGLWNNIYSYDPQELYNYITVILADVMVYKQTGFIKDERFEQSTKSLASSPNLDRLFDTLTLSPILNKPYMRKADLLCALMSFYKSKGLGNYEKGERLLEETFKSNNHNNLNNNNLNNNKIPVRQVKGMGINDDPHRIRLPEADANFENWGKI